MRYTAVTVGLTLGLLSGCAGPTGNVQVGPQHPASPAAAEAPSVPRSQTLAIDTANPPGEVHGSAPPPVEPVGETPCAGDHTTGHSHSSTGHAGHAKPEPKGARSPDGHAAAPAAGRYFSPMHPEVTSADPNARCPKCGMKVNKSVKATTAPTAMRSSADRTAQHQHDHSGGNK